MFFVCIEMLERVLLSLFSSYFMFLIIDNQHRILSYQILHIPSRARDATFVPTVPQFLYMEMGFLLSKIDRLMCRIQKITKL